MGWFQMAVCIAGLFIVGVIGLLVALFYEPPEPADDAETVIELTPVPLDSPHYSQTRQL